MIEIDVGRILHNVQVVRSTIGPDVKLCAVVKGDGYGSGDVQFSRVLERYAQVDMLAVATVEEAVSLREGGIRLPILVLCDTPDAAAREVIEHDLTPSVYRMEFVRHLSALAGERQIPVHMRLDVCAGSPGMPPDQFRACLDELRGLPGIRLEGLYTQLYGAYAEDRAEYEAQLALFDQAVRGLPQELRDRLCIHAASTASFAREEARYDMVRVGAALYGLPHDQNPSPFLPVMTVKSHIISLKTVTGPTFAGYHSAQGTGMRRLATVQGGYEDALYLMFVKNGSMLVHGRRAPIVGEACMDTANIDVTDIPDVKLLDEVVLLGKQGNQEITVEEIMRSSCFTLANCQLAYKNGKRTQRRYGNYPEDEGWRELLHQVMQHSPSVRRAMEGARGLSMRQYVAQLAQFPEQRPLCDPRQVQTAVAAQLEPVLGREAAQRAAQCFPGCALTANHHGVDCFAQSVQGNLMYRELLRARGVDSDLVPVMACSSVPMDNSSYGKGLLLFDTLDNVYPLRLPILPNRCNDSIVGLYPAMDAEAVRRAMELVQSEKYCQKLSPEMRQTVLHVLGGHYLDETVLSLGSYAQQATAINERMTREATGCGFAYVDMEKAAAQLLLEDLRDAGSLAARMLMDAPLRRAVLDRLDGATGCWNAQALRSGQLKAGGTAFFWATGSKWTRAPLQAEAEGLRNLRTGECIAWEGIPQALAEGKIYPALLLCFTTLLFERGLRCFGGCFQPEYLRVMQQGLRAALADVGDAGTAGVIAQRDPSGYLCGPMFLSGERGEPVGIVEMLNRGLPPEHIDRMLDTNFEQAHQPALANLYVDVVPAAQRLTDYQDRLFRKRGNEG